MTHGRWRAALGTLALIGGVGLNAGAQQIKTVFVIAMENHNWTQPANQFTGGIQQIFQNPAAPFINSLVDGTAFANINGSLVHISEQVAYATNYHNVLATAGGNNPHIHPSEPNYIWAEAGDNLGVLNDDDPFAAVGPTNQNTPQHLAAFLTAAGHSWRSYQEDTDLRTDAGKLINAPLPRNEWTVPRASFSGNFVDGTVNDFNGSSQYNYAAKHNPQVFFTNTNGGDDPSPSNPLSQNYAPLQQLFTDLENSTVADYNWITPNQFNDMHTALKGGFNGLAGDPAQINQGDHFLSVVIPAIMASNAYKDHGAIVIWFDESEEDGVVNDNPDDLTHTIPEIIISSRAHDNVKGMPYASPVFYTHSSDLRTWQEIFRVGGLLNDAANANDLSDLFKSGAVPKKP